MQDPFKNAKERWDKSHTPPAFKVGALVLVSKLKFNSIEVAKKLKDSFAGTFMIRELHSPNAVQMKLTGELMKKHPVFPLSLIKTYSHNDNKLFPLCKKPHEIPYLREGE
ncbi:hypothetical protein O181_055239 [Austropuccinia psidii MF-1]|uniref:Uncharacterized protein n=1 Tax=Austropuccinia psidii MF-1 TaxID=1389203 RepID=A0A9Q3E660_9BASI|nr:hypothetical protein [Austropuccinia psidii MF-1]